MQIVILVQKKERKKENTKTVKMRFLPIVILGVAVAAQDDVQSEPFHLVLSSDDTSVSGKKLTACHTGAAIESLCLTDSSSEFYHNTTEGASDPLEGYEPIGTLVYNLPLGMFPPPANIYVGS